MVVKADSKHIKQIASFCKAHILGSRIICLMNCYGFDFDFYNVYLSYSQENTVQCVISDFDGNITIVCTPDCDYNEVSDFLNFINCNSVTTDNDTSSALKLENCELKNAYKYIGNGGDISTAENACENDYRAVYNLISKNIPDSFNKSNEAYFNWLSDFTYRKRRESARIKCIRQDSSIVGCALTSAECEYSAIISGVASDSSIRRKGIGKTVVLSLAEELKKENKDVYVIALNAVAEGFYEHIGFKKHCVIAISER